VSSPVSLFFFFEFPLARDLIGLYHLIFVPLDEVRLFPPLPCRFDTACRPPLSNHGRFSFDADFFSKSGLDCCAVCPTAPWWHILLGFPWLCRLEFSYGSSPFRIFTCFLFSPSIGEHVIDPFCSSSLLLPFLIIMPGCFSPQLMLSLP